MIASLSASEASANILCDRGCKGSSSSFNLLRVLQFLSNLSSSLSQWNGLCPVQTIVTLVCFLDCGINPYHEGKTCKDMFSQFFKPCPKCNIPIQKSKDCNHMKCTYCDADFCYLCGIHLISKHPTDHYNVPGPCFGKCFTEKDVIHPTIKRWRVSNKVSQKVNCW
jgi:hypothetical protein